MRYDLDSKEHYGTQQEIEWLADIFLKNKAKSYLEIGSFKGGSMWAIAHKMPRGSRLVSVEMPMRDSTKQELIQIMNELQQKGYDTNIIWGDSTQKNIIDQVRELGPYDACLIDGNHTLPYVTKDWENYSTMSKMIAFHDINFKPKANVPVNINVPEIWNKLKQQYKHEEYCLKEDEHGIGVLWK